MPLGGDQNAASRHAQDPGLAHERTELAWGRSTLAVLAASVVLIRHLYRERSPFAIVLTIVAVIGVALWSAAQVLTRRDRPHAMTRETRSLTARLLTYGTLLICVSALLDGLLIVG